MVLSNSHQQHLLSLDGDTALVDVFVHLLPDLDMAPLDFATINYISSDSLPPWIGTECVYRILSTMAVSSHILLSDHFSVIHHFKRFHQQNP